MRVSSNFFTVLAAQPILGRTHSREEERAGVTPSVVISHGLWNRRYGADPEVIGRVVELDGETVHPDLTRHGLIPYDRAATTRDSTRSFTHTPPVSLRVEERAANRRRHVCAGML